MRKSIFTFGLGLSIVTFGFWGDIAIAELAEARTKDLSACNVAGGTPVVPKGYRKHKFTEHVGIALPLKPIPLEKLKYVGLDNKLGDGEVE